MKLEHVETLAEVLLQEKQLLLEQAEAENKDLNIYVTDVSEGDISIGDNGEIFAADNICSSTITVSISDSEDEAQMKALSEAIAVIADALDIELDEDHVVFSGDVSGDSILEEAELVMSCGFDQ